ncbi:hypothetical protein LP7551_04889 [Roseibium album]|nr:hypothetical protein LP7551_04889 [Roseibium album]
MQDFEQEIVLTEKDEKLFEYVDEMLGPFGKNLPRTHGIMQRKLKTPFDTSRPNQHDTKSDFQAEYEAITTCLEGLKIVFGAALPDNFKNKDKAKDKEHVWRNMKRYVDEKFRVNEKLHERSEALDLILNNIADIGGFSTSLMTTFALQTALEARKKELDHQEKRFWNLGHRAPDYYARAIALRLAKLYANETGKKPTYGTSGETGEPSTTYTKTLPKVFELLEIKGGGSTYAQWAIGKISDDDLNDSGAYREYDVQRNTFVYPGHYLEFRILTDQY